MAKREPAAATPGILAYAARTVAVSLAAGLFLGLVGPFGTFQLVPLLPRVAYWVSMILAGTLFVPVLYLILHHWIGGRVSALIYVPLAAIVGALPVTLMVVAITLVLLGQTVSFRLELYLLVLVITVPLVAIQHGMMLMRTRRAAEAAPLNEAPPSSPLVEARPRLLDRLPGRLGTDLLCLQMEDHYVRVHTALGQELILMRMRDAVAELDGLNGAQVHRSWWVARAAVADWTREGKALTLRLANGLEVPVARDRAPELRAAGWLR